MTIEEAVRILDPETTREALRPYAYDPERRIQIVEEACRVAVRALRDMKTADHFRDLKKMVDQVIADLRRLSVETGPLACFGCGREHNCGVHGCRILRDAAALIQMQEMRINELRGHTDE